MKISRAEVERHFEVVPSRCTSEEIVFICPVPGCKDKTGNRSVNLKTGKTNCFRCNIGGNFVAWARKLGYVIAGESGETAESGDLLEMLKVERGHIIAPVTSNIKLPEGSHKIADNRGSVYTRMIEKMAISKRLTLEDMIEAQVHFTRIHPDWEDYAIFPVTEWNRLVLYQGRLFRDDSPKPGKRFPSKKEAFYGASYWVYGLDEARSAECIIVVESILNVLSLRKKILQENVHGVVPVGVFKHAVSRPQTIKLLSLPAKEICFMFDADATFSSWKEAEKLVNHRVCTIAEIQPTLSETQDPNDDIDLAWDAFLDRKKASVTMGLMSRL